MDIIFDTVVGFSIFELLSSLAAESGLFELVAGGLEAIKNILEPEGITALYEIANGSANDVFSVKEIELADSLKSLFSKDELAVLYKDLRLDIQPIGKTNLKGFISRVSLISKNIIKNGSYQSLLAAKNLIKNIVIKGVEFGKNHISKTIAPGALIGVIGGSQLYKKFKKNAKNKIKNIDSHLIHKHYKTYEPNNFGSNVQN